MPLSDLEYYQRIADDHAIRVKTAIQHSGDRTLPFNKFRMSGAGKGHYQLWYEKHPDSPLTPKPIERVFNPVKGGANLVGTLIHDGFQKYDPYCVIKEEPYIADSFEYEDGYFQITGHPDNIQLHQNFLLDYKSVGPFGWQYILKGIKTHYRAQVTCYTAHFEREAFVVQYINSMTLEHISFAEYMDHDLYNKIIQKFKRVLTCTDPAELPDDCEAWRCNNTTKSKRYCPYWQGCPVRRTKK